MTRSHHNNSSRNKRSVYLIIGFLSLTSVLLFGMFKYGHIPGLPFGSKGVSSSLSQEGSKIKAPDGCRYWTPNRLAPPGENGPHESYTMDFSCDGQTGAIQDEINDQLRHLGYHESVDTTPNSEQVLRDSFTNNATSITYTISSVELGKRTGQHLSNASLRSEHASGISIIVTQAK